MLKSKISVGDEVLIFENHAIEDSLKVHPFIKEWL